METEGTRQAGVTGPEVTDTDLQQRWSQMSNFYLAKTGKEGKDR